MFVLRHVYSISMRKLILGVCIYIFIWTGTIMSSKKFKKVDALKEVRRPWHCQHVLYFTVLVRFMTDYCDVVIASMNVSHLDRFKKLQNRGTRIILGLDWRIHVTPMLDGLKWLNVTQKHGVHAVVRVYKITNGSALHTECHIF